MSIFHLLLLYVCSTLGKLFFPSTMHLRCRCPCHVIVVCEIMWFIRDLYDIGTIDVCYSHTCGINAFSFLLFLPWTTHYLLACLLACLLIPLLIPLTLPLTQPRLEHTSTTCQGRRTLLTPFHNFTPFCLDDQ